MDDEFAPTAQNVEQPDEPASEEPAFEVPEPPETGDPAVDDAVLRLAAAASEPLEAQVAVFDTAHRSLQDRLADVES